MNLGLKPLLAMLSLSLVCLAPATAHSPTGPMTITTDGIGGYTVGTPKAKIAKTIGKGNPNYDQHQGCDIHPALGVEDLYVMIENDIVTSIITHNAKYKTPSGAHVGMTDAAIKRIYGKRLKREGHTYQDAPAAYYTFRSSSGNKIVFDVNEKRKVSEIRAGRSAGYVEGCL